MVYCVWADVRPELQLRMIGRAAQGPIGPEDQRLPCLKVVDLVDEMLEFRDGVAALVGSHALIDGQGHDLGILAHLSNRILIRLRGGLIVVHEHGAKFSGDLLGSPRLMEEGHELLPALLLIGDPHRFHIRECKAPLADLCLLLFGQPPQPVFRQLQGGLSSFFEPLRRGNLDEARGFGIVLLQSRFEGAHLPRIDRSEEDPAVGHDTLKEVGAQTIIGGIGPVDIRTGEPSLDSLTDLSKKNFILRQSFMPMSVK